MAFHVGQRIICVDDHEPDIAFALPGMEVSRGQVYVVERVGLVSWVDGEPCVKLVGIRDAYGDDEQFWSTRFRPVIERKTDISALQALLVPGSKILENQT